MEENCPRAEGHSVLDMGLGFFKKRILGSMDPKTGLKGMDLKGRTKTRVGSPGQEPLLPESKGSIGSHHSLELP